MAWFDFIKAAGYFDPKNNPEPIKVKDGFQIPFWESLGYLEKLSLQIKQGNYLEFIDEILGVIKNVSENPKDNYHTWYLILRILQNLPNEKITNEILHFIPIWLSGKFGTMLQSSELCENLIPKFLNDSPTKDDIEKAEIILQYLFSVEKSRLGKEGQLNGEGYSYESNIYLYYLSDAMITKNLASKVSQHCTDKIILELGRTIKRLLLDYPGGIKTTIINDCGEYEVATFIDTTDLIISTNLKGNKATHKTSTLPNFEDLNEKELKIKFVEIINHHGITYLPTQDPDDTFKTINFLVHNDLVSLMSFNDIDKLDDKYRNHEKILDVFCLIFRDLLNAKAKHNPEVAIALLRIIFNDKEYRLPFFKRIALYVICENWTETNSIFWEFVNRSDPFLLFSKPQYQKEVYRLLSKNQHLIDAEEKLWLQCILDKGPQDDKEGRHEKYIDYWQLRWYSALKNIEPFRERYLALSELLGLTDEHFENLGVIKTWVGSVSPFSVEELLDKTNVEIVNSINSFKPGDHWEGPSIEGLGETIGKTVETRPSPFSEEIELYKNAPFIYTYFILNGFKEAWKNNKPFNWQKVLEFCHSYISKVDFYSDRLCLQNDRLIVSVNWVVGAVANLLTEGLQNDQNAFDLELLPIAKDIIKILALNLKPSEDFSETNMDHPTYSLNSTAGKVLRALLDYSLRRARNDSNNENTAKWEPDMCKLFEGALAQGINDGYILEGMYFQQFYFLDKDWIVDQVKKNYTLDENRWRAFFGGLEFGNIPFRKDLFQLFYNHYDRAISNHVDIKDTYNNGLVRHLVAFYIWGWEDLNHEGLLLKFLNIAHPSSIQKLVNYLWRQEDYLNQLDEKEKEKFRIIIFELWDFLIRKFQDCNDEEEQKILSGLTNFIVFFPELNDSITQLIQKSCRQIRQNFVTYDLFKSLCSLKGKGDNCETAKYIGEIILSIPLDRYLPHFDSQNLIELVSFLFHNHQKETAIIICNKISSQGQDFLKETYNSFNH